MDVLQLSFGRFHGFAEQIKGLQGIVQPFFSYLQPILDQDFRGGSSGGMVQLRGVHG